MIAKRFLEIVCVQVVLFLVLLPAASEGGEESEVLVPVRIGWQMPAVTQAGIVQVLKRTDVLARHGLDPSLVPFSYGAPEIEAAFAGELDVFFAGDQPAINLLTYGGKWKIVARIYYDRVAVIVPKDSPVRTIRDLKGKIVASPFGSIAHREAFQEQQAAGLDPEKDVENRNLDILEIRQRVLDGGDESWEGIDAAAIWEPDLSSFQLEGLTRNLTETRALGVVAISDEFISRHPEATVQFLVALVRAWDFFSSDPNRVMRWYNDDTQLDYNHEALIRAVGIDPNINTKSIGDVDLRLEEEHLSILEKNAAWGEDAWEDGGQIRRFVDHDLLARAIREVSITKYEDLKVILPSVRKVAEITVRESYGLDSIPLWIVFLIMVLITLLALEIGLRLGLRSRDKASRESGRPIGTVGAAVLGMMAFVIAITFGSATNRFDARKTALLEDVTAIQTAYLRTNILPEPHRTTVRSLLRDYVQARVGIVYAYGQPETLRPVERHARSLQVLMWSHVETMAEDNGFSGTHAPFASALTNVFNMHTKRVVLGAYYRIPGFMWWAIIFASAVAMVAVGFQFGVAGGRRYLTINFALALTFALVMMLAFDLDRAGEGLISVNQQPMIQLYQSMNAQK